MLLPAAKTVFVQENAALTAASIQATGLPTIGLEGMFEETRTYHRSVSGPPGAARIAQIGERYGVKSVGPPIAAPSATNP